MSLHEKFLIAVKSERKITLDILNLINEAEFSKLYLQRGHSSMFDYLTKELGYSEGSANRRLQSARLLRSTSGVTEGLKSGDLNLSQTALLQSAFRQQRKINESSVEQKNILLNQVKGKSQVETKRIIQDTFPEVKFNSERLAVRPKGRTLISFEVTQEELDLIERAKSILSHACPEQKTKDVFLKLCDKLVKSKINPKLAKKGEVKGKDQKDEKSIGESKDEINLPFPKAREAIPASVRRQIFINANHRCEFKSPHTNQRCGSQRFLEIDHIKPVAFGGASTSENLRVLCRAHNQYSAERAGLGRVHCEAECGQISKHLSGINFMGILIK